MIDVGLVILQNYNTVYILYWSSSIPFTAEGRQLLCKVTAFGLVSLCSLCILSWPGIARKLPYVHLSIQLSTPTRSNGPFMRPKPYREKQNVDAETQDGPVSAKPGQDLQLATLSPSYSPQWQCQSINRVPIGICLLCTSSSQLTASSSILLWIRTD